MNSVSAYLPSFAAKHFQGARLEPTVIARANETIKRVEGAWVEEEKVIVHEGKIKAYEVIMKVTFLLED